jgi:curli biogenesis system outer membrane secretion channel CsgG
MKLLILFLSLCAIVLTGCGKAETAPTTDQTAQPANMDQSQLTIPDRPKYVMTGKHKY